jgi:hypothetical protein
MRHKTGFRNPRFCFINLKRIALKTGVKAQPSQWIFHKTILLKKRPPPGFCYNLPIEDSDMDDQNPSPDISASSIDRRSFGIILFSRFALNMQLLAWK